MAKTGVLYTYRCPKCRGTWEERRSIGDYKSVCPKCKEAIGHVIITPVHFRIAGKR